MNHSKDFLWKNFTKVARFQGFLFLFFEIAIFRQWVSANLKILYKILLSSLTCSQNWLIPLADDSKVWLHHKTEWGGGAKKKKKKKKTVHYYMPTFIGIQIHLHTRLLHYLVD